MQRARILVHEWAQEKYQSTLVVLLLATPIVSMLNGWSLHHISSKIDIGQVVAVMVMFLATWLLATQDRRKFYVLICLGASFAISVVVSTVYHGQVFGTLVWFSRIYMTVSLFLATLHLLESSSAQQHERILRAVQNAGLIIGWSLVISYIFHIGYHTYLQGVGFKGLYYGQNDLSATVSMLFPIVMYRVTRRKSWTTIVNLVVYAVTMILLGTKTAYLFLIVTPIAMIWIRNKFHIKQWRKQWSLKAVVLTAMAIIIVILVFFGLFYKFLRNVFDYQLYFFTHSESLFVYLTSGRVKTLPYLWHILGSHPLILFFGTGYTAGLKLLAQSAGSPILLEFDPLLLLLNGGLLLLVCVAVAFSPMVKELHPMRLPAQRLTFTAFGIGLFCSVFAGHVLESALAGTYLAVIAALFTSYQRIPYEADRLE